MKLRIKIFSVVIFSILFSCNQDRQKTPEEKKSNSIESTKKVEPSQAKSEKQTVQAIDQTKEILLKLENLEHKKTQGKSKYFLSKSDRQLTISNYQIPIDSVALTYTYNNKYEGFGPHFVEFHCLSKNDCIYESSSNKYLVGLSTELASKEDCFKYMELYDNLKSSIK